MRNIRLFIIALFGIASLWVGCSDTQKVTGTSEEENEVIARNESSSSSGPEAKSSSSKDGESKSSSSSGWNVSADSQDISSSSSKVPEPVEGSSSSEKDTQTTSSSSDKEESSSSSEPPPSFESSSSDRPGAVEGSTNNPNTFDYYISTFALDSAAFDSSVMASAIVYVEPPPATLPVSSSSTPKEFREPGLHQFMKDNIDTLKLKFPKAVKRYKDLITAIENGSAECNLYLYNVQGSAEAAGHTLASITPDSITVFDIVSEKCGSTETMMFGFLFTYCGEMNSEPELVRVTVESDNPKGKCPNGQIMEWIKEN